MKRIWHQKTYNVLVYHETKPKPDNKYLTYTHEENLA